MNAPLVHCRQCDGHGRHEISHVYAATLALLSDEWQTTTALLAKLSRVNQTALCNRLAWLKREGFAVSRKTEHNGRMLEWRKATP